MRAGWRAYLAALRTQLRFADMKMGSFSTARGIAIAKFNYYKGMAWSGQAIDSVCKGVGNGRGLQSSGVVSKQLQREVLCLVVQSGLGK